MRICLPLFFFLLSISISAQEQSDSIEYKQEYNFFEKERFIDAYDFVFQTQEVQKSMLKLDALGVVLRLPQFGNGYFSFFPSLMLAYEYKIDESFSINTELSTSLSLVKFPGTQSKMSSYFSFGFRAQPRWYYDMKKRIKNKVSANNLSGNYFAVDISFSQGFGDQNDFGTNFYSLGIRYGLQRRIFNQGFLDIQIGPHIYQSHSFRRLDGTLQSYSSKGWTFFSRVSLGWLLNTTKDDDMNNRKCDAFQCYEERNQLFKFDLLGLVNISDNDNSLPSISGNLSFGYERKVGQSWSVNTEVNWNYGLYNTFLKAHETQQFDTGIRMSITPRYYYDLKKRIAMGKTANNLNGNYIGIHLSASNLIVYSSIPTFLNNDFVNPPLNVTYLGGDNTTLGPRKVTFGVPKIINFSITPVWGIQRRIFKKGYINYAIGLNAMNINWLSNDKPSNEKRFSITPNSGFASTGKLVFNPFSQLKIGLAF